MKMYQVLMKKNKIGLNGFGTDVDMLMDMIEYCGVTLE
jgi:hypothetical protein